MHLENVSSFCLFLLDFKAFEEAAQHFQPYIKFFATFDKGVSTYETPIRALCQHGILKFDLSTTFSLSFSNINHPPPSYTFSRSVRNMAVSGYRMRDEYKDD